MRLPLLRCRLLACALLAAALPALAADGFRVVRSYPHDPRAFTQGLIYLDGHLYESDGLEGHSSLRKVDLATGRVLAIRYVPKRYFAEGLTNWKSTLVQLTWLSHVALVYKRDTFQFLRAYHFPGEGWGLTQDSKNLILSDGTSTLRFLNPSNFREVRRVTVTDRGKPVTQINELEYIHGQVYANIWHSNRIARISPATGRVLGWIDLTGLRPLDVRTNPEAVLNGIAYDSVHDRLFVTGKLWPRLFEIKVIPASGRALPSAHVR